MPVTRPLADRLADLVDRSGGDDACWPFLGCVSKNRGAGPGYGTIRGDRVLDERTGRLKRGPLIKAHRAALVLATGENPPEQDACHVCDNTVCCNPRHLFWGSHRYNMMDYIRKYGRLGVSKFAPPPPRPEKPLLDSIDFEFGAA
jgi:hypothetical protein